MEHLKGQLCNTANALQWNDDLIFQLLSDPGRRRILVKLARGGPQTVSQLNTGGILERDMALKHLAVLRTAGMVNKSPNPRDGRRPIYSVSEKVPLQITEEACVIDFGSCLLRLK